jgi:hypothetical protein
MLVSRGGNAYKEDPKSLARNYHSGKVIAVFMNSIDKGEG